jgi:hypothetical protein
LQVRGPGCTLLVVAAYKRKFSPSDFKHVRSPKAGVVYNGKTPFRYQDLEGNTREVKPGTWMQRRQYENLRYKAGGWKSKSEYEKIIHGHNHIRDGGRDVHEANAYHRWAQIYADNHGVSVRTAMGADSPYAQAFAAALRDKFRDTSPGSPFADLLVLVGLRTDSDTWDVGDSPGGK